tara:strand:+ start:1496 stop:1699 length:204 start_codon:yes stop_codon:yes gene_type:complete
VLYDEDGTWIDINRDTLIDALDGMPVDMFIANNDHIDTEDVTNNDEVIEQSVLSRSMHIEVLPKVVM